MRTFSRLFGDWLRIVRGNTTGKRRPCNIAPELEVLENRLVPSAMVDLTARGASASLNGAIFQQGDPGLGGTGLQSFVRLQARGGTEQGYNTDARPLQYDATGNTNVTHGLKLSAVPQVQIGGRSYREFVLEINENNALLSLEELRLFVGDTGNLRGYNGNTHQLAGQDAVYDLDATGDAWVKLDNRLVKQGGKGDMTLYVSETTFAGANPNSYLYLYSKFGGHNAADGSFEQWSTHKNYVPPPPPPPAPPPPAVTGSITGTVFIDDGNGVYDPGLDMLGFGTVWIDSNNDGLFDTGDVSAVVDNAANGQYSLNGLALSQSYVVNFIADLNYVALTPAASATTGSVLNFGELPAFIPNS